MFNKASLKAKIIVFIVISLVVLGVAAKAGSKTRQETGSAKSQQNISAAQPQTETQAPSEAELTKQKEEEKKKRLDEKYQQAYAAFHSRKRIEAIQLADEILKEDENYYKAYNIKGIAQCYSGQFKKGMENIDKSIQLKPDFGYARFNKALAYELNGQFDLALKWYDNALQVEDYVWSYYGKASIYGRRGDAGNTVKYLKKAIAMDSSVKDVAREEADFKPVRSSKEFQELLK